MDGFTYREVGATRDPGSLPPPGYRLLRCRVRLGAGPEVLAAAGQAVLDWRMHRGAGLAVDADTPAAAPGVRVVIGAARPEDGERLSDVHVRSVLAAMRRQFLTTVVDCGSTLDKPTVAALAGAATPAVAERLCA